MRFFEFGGPEGVGVDKFVMALRNYVGRAASKKSSSKLNWAAIERMTTANGFEFAADYETFKSMYDASPAIQGLVKNFNADGIELNVPGAPDADKEPTQGTGQTSQQAVDKIAASAAPQQLSTQA
jgi:hypothetical protein